MPFQGRSYTGGTLHHFDTQLVAYEHASQATAEKPARHSLVFITGLFGTLLSVGYVHALARSLPADWVLVEVELSSARLGFGVGSISNDVAELAALVGYLRGLRLGGKVVLLGHSTGCQDALAYVSTDLTPKERKAGATWRPPVDGIVLQAPVSDRTGITIDTDPKVFASAREAAEKLVAEKRGTDILPRSFTAVLNHAPTSARRWLSLVSPPDDKLHYEDDMFSHDLGDNDLARTFGKLADGVRVLTVLCGADQYVPDSVDQRALGERWKAVVAKGKGTWDEDSGILDGADHALERCDDSVVQEFTRRVKGFVTRVAESS